MIAELYDNENRKQSRCAPPGICTYASTGSTRRVRPPPLVGRRSTDAPATERNHFGAPGGRARRSYG